MYRATIDACRTAARAYVRAHIGGLAQLTNAEKAEILGMFTAFYLHTSFAAITGEYIDPNDKAKRIHYIDRTDWLIPLPSTSKNFFDVMVKTGLDKLLRNGNTAVVDEMNEWWMSKSIALGDVDDIKALAVALAKAFYESTNPTVKKWFTTYWHPNKDNSWDYAKAVVKSYAQNFDPITGAPVPTSPTGSNPPAYILGAGPNSAGFVASVVEVRNYQSAFSLAAKASNAATVNAYVKSLTGTIEWDGAADTWPTVS